MHESAKENLLMCVHAKKLVDSGLVKSTLQVEFSVGITTDSAVYSSQRSYSLEANPISIDCNANWALYLYTPKKWWWI